MKKLGSPPRSESIRFGGFDENVAHHAYRADHAACCYADDEFIAAVRHRYGPVDIDRRGIRYFVFQWHLIIVTDMRVDADVCVGVLCEGAAVHVVGSGRWKTVAFQRILHVSVSNGEHGRAHPVPAVHDRKIHFHDTRRIRSKRLRDVRVREDVSASHAATPNPLSRGRCRLRRRALPPPAGSAIRSDRRRTCPSPWSWYRQSHGCQQYSLLPLWWCP